VRGRAAYGGGVKGKDAVEVEADLDQECVRESVPEECVRGSVPEECVRGSVPEECVRGVWEWSGVCELTVAESKARMPWRLRRILTFSLGFCVSGRDGANGPTCNQ